MLNAADVLLLASVVSFVVFASSLVPPELLAPAVVIEEVLAP